MDLSDKILHIILPFIFVLYVPNGGKEKRTSNSLSVKNPGSTTLSSQKPVKKLPLLPLTLYSYHFFTTYLLTISKPVIDTQ